jgi:hypothetical protein
MIRHLVCVGRPLLVYAAAALVGVAMAQEAAPVAADPSMVGELGLPVAGVIAAALIRGWTPTIRVVHVHEGKQP